jgi:TonB family protein
MRSEWRFLPCLLALTLAAPALWAQAPDEPLMAGTEEVPVPRRVSFVQPVYPPEAAARGLRGIVILSLVVGESGRVEDVEVVRSVPPFDAAAIAAVQQWSYEPTRIDGRPVRVRVTVPISFLMKLPEVTRQDGIPELRSGALPPFPTETRQVETVSAELSLAPDGQVAGAQVLDGNSPWSEALIAALRTWRFDDNELGPGVEMSFRVEAQFIPAGDGDEQRVALQLTGLRRSESRPAVVEPVEPAPSPTRSAEAAPPSPPEPPAEVADEGPDVPAAPDTSDAGPGEPAPPLQPAVEAPAEQPAETAELAPAEVAEVTDAAGEAEAAEALPAEAGEEAQAPPPSATTPTPKPEPPSAPEPATEVLGGSPEPAPGPALPAEPGVSSVRGVFLEAGVPDLSQGRRPTVPPYARMQGVEGSVRVRFAVDAAGQSFVSAVDGPEELRPAARATVESWLFSRQTARRLYLVAEISYESAVATAVVEPER